MSVFDAQQRISAPEFSEWIAYHSINPFTVDRTENMLATVCSILVNVNRGKGSREVKPQDFIPKYGGKTYDTAQEIEIKLRALLNGNN